MKPEVWMDEFGNLYLLEFVPGHHWRLYYAEETFSFTSYPIKFRPRRYLGGNKCKSLGYL